MAERMAGERFMPLETEITSTTNNLVKETAKLAQKKYRNETKLFLIEGQKAVEEAVSLGINLENVFVLKEKAVKYSHIKNKILTNEAVLKKISTTETAPEIVATAKQIGFSGKDILSKNKIVLLENIKDSGNLGTILRTCTALGVEAVILAGDTVDIYNPKTVRSAVGNMFKIPFLTLKSVCEVKKLLQSHKFYAAVVPQPGTTSIIGLKLPEKSVIMFGSEADGLSAEAIKISDEKITIPISKTVESLNLSAAATICIWELFNNPAGRTQRHRFCRSNHK